MTPLRLAFMGTPQFAVPALLALLASRHQVVVVYTQPPRPSGRGQRVHPSPVHEAALKAGIEVRHPVSLKPEVEKAAFATLNLDAAVVAAYGLILPRAVLAAPRHGCLNIHGSLLPRWRGAAPIQHAVLAGDAETGITIMAMEAGLDTGPMLAKQAVPVTQETTSAGLYRDLAEIGARMIVPVLEGFVTGTILPVPQDDTLATLAPKLSREDGRLDWTRPAAELDRQVRALVPWPGAWFEHAGEVVKVGSVTPSPRLRGEGRGEGTWKVTELTSPPPPASRRPLPLSEEGQDAALPGTILNDQLTIACGTGALQLLRVQRPGKSWVDGAAFLRGTGLKPGDRLA